MWGGLGPSHGVRGGAGKWAGGVDLSVGACLLGFERHRRASVFLSVHSCVHFPSDGMSVFLPYERLYLRNASVCEAHLFDLKELSNLGLLTVPAHALGVLQP